MRKSRTLWTSAEEGTTHSRIRGSVSSLFPYHRPKIFNNDESQFPAYCCVLRKRAEKGLGCTFGISVHRLKGCFRFHSYRVIMKVRPLRCSCRSMKLLEPNTLSWGAESLMPLCMSALQRKA